MSPFRQILIVHSYYLPGYKSGGPVQTLANIAEALGDQFGVHVFTADRDFQDDSAYSGVRSNSWNRVGKANVFYSSTLSIWHLRRCIKEVQPDLIYLNSYFSRLTWKALLLRKLGACGSSTCLIAPRGELAPGALSLKSWRKKVWIRVFHPMLYGNSDWQASSTREKREICRALKQVKDANCHVAPDVVSSTDGQSASLKKVRGSARFVFLSRVTRVKNLLFLLDLLPQLRGEFQLDIFGPIDDGAYWRDCLKSLSSKTSTRVSYHGPIEHQLVGKVFSGRHFFVLPTLGENFGHVIVEAMSAGCPALISDRTQWQYLGRAGWVLPLAERERWRGALQACIDMEDDEYSGMRRAAVAYGKRVAYEQSGVEATRNLFLHCMQGERHG